jgi:ABC-type glycerol-3-phosphate transport system permease component
VAKVRTVGVILFSLLLLFPTYWMVVGSLQPLQGVLRLPPELVPRHITMANYTILFKNNPIVRWAANTGAITVVAVVLGVFTAALAGYAMSAYRIPKWVFWSFVAVLALPRMAIVIPQFVTFRVFGFRGFVGVLIPLVCFPSGVLLFKVQADALPKSIHDAAKIDGATPWQTFIHLVLPLCIPALGIMVISKAMEAMGDYLWQSLLLTRKEMMTMMVGLVGATMRRGEIAINPIGATLAAGVLMMLPMLLVFVVFQRSFKQSLLGGATKE